MRIRDGAAGQLIFMFGAYFRYRTASSAMARIRARLFAPIPKLARLTIQARMIRPAPIAMRRSRGLNCCQIATGILLGRDPASVRDVPVAVAYAGRQAPARQQRRPAVAPAPATERAERRIL